MTQVETRRAESAEMAERAANEVIEEGNQLMSLNHDPGGLDPKEYHTSKHPETLQIRGELVADVFGYSWDRRKTAQMAISDHDTIINYTKPDPNNILGMISRHRGARAGDLKGEEGNEAESARGFKKSCQDVNRKYGRTVISATQIRNGIYAIDVTYPEVDLGENYEGAKFVDYPFYEKVVRQNPNIELIAEKLAQRGITKGPHFFQPHLENPLEERKYVPEEVITVALVDLGAAGMAEHPQEFFQEGDSEFRELFVNIKESDNFERLMNGNAEEDIEDRGKVVGAMLGWLRSQPGFAFWQMLRFEKIVYLMKRYGQLDREKERSLRSVFSHFEDNIFAALERSEKLKSESDKLKGTPSSFSYLAKQMGYSTL